MLSEQGPSKEATSYVCIIYLIPGVISYERLPEIPKAQKEYADEQEQKLSRSIKEVPGEVEIAMDKLSFSDALGRIWGIIVESNVYIEKQAPWSLAKKGETDRLAFVLSKLVKALSVVTEEIAPFIPGTAQRIKAQMNLNGDKVAKGEPLFPRLAK